MPRLFAALALAVVLAVAAGTPARDDAKPFKLRWFGLSMFQLETPAGKRIVFDPHAAPEFGRNLVQADIVCLSHLHSDHTQLEVVENVKAARVFKGLTEPRKGRASEWAKIDETVGAIRVRTVGLYHDAEDGLVRGRNSAFILDVEGVRLCHLGDLGHDLSPEQVKAIGPVDVLFVPVGGVYTLNGGGAKRAVAALKPGRFVLPMHYGVPGFDELTGPDEFLDGTDNVDRKLATNEFSFPAEVPAPAAGAKPAPVVTVLLGWKK